MIRQPLTDRQIAALANGKAPGWHPDVEDLDIEEALTSMAQEIRRARVTLRILKPPGDG